MDSPLAVILQMVWMLIQNTIGTLIGMIVLFGKLAGSLGIASEIGGPALLVASAGILGIVGFFLLKLFLGGSKRLLILGAIAIVLAYLALIGSLL